MCRWITKEQIYTGSLKVSWSKGPSWGVIWKCQSGGSWVNRYVFSVMNVWGGRYRFPGCWFVFKDALAKTLYLWKQTIVEANQCGSKLLWKQTKLCFIMHSNMYSFFLFGVKTTTFLASKSPNISVHYKLPHIGRILKRTWRTFDWRYLFPPDNDFF